MSLKVTKVSNMKFLNFTKINLKRKKKILVSWNLKQKVM